MPSSKGPYSRTPVKDYYLDIMAKLEIPKSMDDEFYIIEKKYEYRPDILARELYGNEAYWYVFALRNMDEIKDPIYDFVEGVEIRIPKPSAIKRLR